MTRLGQLLVQEQLITPEQLDEALTTQQTEGGRLGTNLLEYGFLKEPDLARALGKQHNMPFAFGEMLPEAKALAVAPAAWFDENDVLPMRMDATRLTIAVMEPRRIKPLDDLGFKLDKRIVEVVIPEFRMNQLLRKYCKAFRPERLIDAGKLRPSRKAERVGDPQVSDADGVINNDAFASIFANAPAAGKPARPPSSAGLAAPRPPSGVGPPAAQRPSSTGLPAGARAATGSHLATMPSLEAVPARAPGASDSAEPRAEETLPQEPSPIGFTEAQGLVRRAKTGEEIAAALLRFARSRFRRAVLLAVQPNTSTATGWTGLGHGIMPRAVRRVSVALNEPSAFSSVRNGAPPFAGPLTAAPAVQGFFTALGVAPPQSALIIGIPVTGKVVNLLYLDNGAGQPTPPDLAELIIVTQSVSRAYEALVRSKGVGQ